MIVCSLTNENPIFVVCWLNHDTMFAFWAIIQFHWLITFVWTFYFISHTITICQINYSHHCALRWIIFYSFEVSEFNLTNIFDFIIFCRFYWYCIYVIVWIEVDSYVGNRVKSILLYGASVGLIMKFWFYYPALPVIWILVYSFHSTLYYKQIKLHIHS